MPSHLEVITGLEVRFWEVAGLSNACDLFWSDHGDSVIDLLPIHSVTSK